jgi:hypothetical protein
MIERGSLSAASYHLLQRIADGDSRLPVTEPQITHAEILVAEGLIRREVPSSK